MHGCSNARTHLIFYELVDDVFGLFEFFSVVDFVCCGVEKPGSLSGEESISDIICIFVLLTGLEEMLGFSSVVPM